MSLNSIEQIKEPEIRGKSNPGVPDRIETDVIVIGGGGAGLAASIEAAALGRQVILLERNAELGGSTARSIGSFTATNTPHQLRKGIKDSPDDHYEDMSTLNDRLGVQENLELRRILVDNASQTFRWLMSMGVEFFGPLPEHNHRKPRMHNVLPNSRAYIYHLEREGRRIGVDIRTLARARQLLFDGQRVIGVVAETERGAVEFRARGGVVLTTGDFSANSEMKSKYIGEAFGPTQPVNPTNSGDGHLMAMELGGHIVYPHLQHGGIRFQPPPSNWVASLPPHKWLTKSMNFAMNRLPPSVLRPFIMSFLTTILVPSPKLFGAGAILINRNGERFDDERTYGSGPYPKPAPKLAAQPEQYGYIVFDGRIKEAFSSWPNYMSTAPGIAYAYIPDYQRNRKDIYNEAPSLARLAKKIDIEPDVLERTVAEYNRSIVDDVAGSTRPQLDKGPFVAMGPVRFYMNFTDGGLAVNRNLQVLGNGERPIEGLFAAGFTGMGGILLEGHGHHLGWAFTSGRLAGRNAAFRVTTEDLDRGH